MAKPIHHKPAQPRTLHNLTQGHKIQMTA